MHAVSWSVTQRSSEEKHIYSIGSAKTGEPSEAKSGKPINVVHMSKYFRAFIDHCNLPMDEKKLVKV